MTEAKGQGEAAGRVLVKLGLLAAPWLAVLLLQSLVLPFDAFTARCWEALSVKHFRTLLPGPFYPDRVIVRLERGDLARNLPHPRRMTRMWITDAHGFREYTPGCPTYPVVLLGDSLVVGTFLDERDTPASILRAETGLCTYPFAPKTINDFLREYPKIAPPPKVVVYIGIERYLDLVDRVSLPGKAGSRRLRGRLQDWVTTSAAGKRAMVFLDRAVEPNFFHFVRFRLDHWTESLLDEDETALRRGRHGMLFFEGPSANRVRSEETLDSIAATFVSYRDTLARKNIRFLFAAVPNKESIYNRELPVPSESTLLRAILDRLARKNVETVDLLTPYKAEYLRTGEPLHQIEDSHWNESGVRLAMRLIAERIAAPK